MPRCAVVGFDAPLIETYLFCEPQQENGPCEGCRSKDACRTFIPTNRSFEELDDPLITLSSFDE